MPAITAPGCAVPHLVHHDPTSIAGCRRMSAPGSMRGPRPNGAIDSATHVGGGHSSFAARVAAAGLQGVARRERRTRHHVSLSPPAGHVHRSLHRCMDSLDRRTPGRREPGGRTSLDRAKRAPCDTHSGWGTSARSRGAGPPTRPAPSRDPRTERIPRVAGLMPSQMDAGAIARCPHESAGIPAFVISRGVARRRGRGRRASKAHPDPSRR